MRKAQLTSYGVPTQVTTRTMISDAESECFRRIMYRYIDDCFDPRRKPRNLAGGKNHAKRLQSFFLAAS